MSTVHVQALIGLLCGNFDEFSQQLDSFADRKGQTHFGNDPVLDFVETAQERVQIGGDSLEVGPSEDHVNELVLNTTVTVQRTQWT